MAENMVLLQENETGGDRSLKATPQVTEISVARGCAMVPGSACQTGRVKPLRRLIVVGALVLAGGCSRTPQRGVAAFCEKLGKDHTLLELPMTTPEEITTMVARYREVDKLAPEEIRDQWHAVTELIAKVAASDVSKPKQPDLINTIYATVKSIDATKKYTKETCNVDFTIPITPPTSLVTEPATTSTS
jgi:hypothetical protein